MTSAAPTSSSSTPSTIVAPAGADIDPNEKSILEVGKQFPRVVDVSWRLSLITNSSSVRKVYEPTYLICLTVVEDGKLRDVSFACNQEEMHDLLQKLREATSQIERSSSAKS
jgi:hypothetical protein